MCLSPSILSRVTTVQHLSKSHRLSLIVAIFLPTKMAAETVKRSINTQLKKKLILTGKLPSGCFGSHMFKNVLETFQFCILKRGS